MNPFKWSFREQFLAGAAVSFGLIVLAVTLGGILRLEPCPLCIFQRAAFGALGVVFLLGGLFAPVGATARAIWSALAALAAVAGIAIAGRHVWLQLFPTDVPTCGAPFSFMRETMDTPNLIRQLYNQALTAKGDCALIDWTFLGISMPGWSLVWFILLFVWIACVALVRRGDPARLY